MHRVLAEPTADLPECGALAVHRAHLGDLPLLLGVLDHLVDRLPVLVADPHQVEAEKSTMMTKWFIR